jgi:hypothetical protein
MVTGSELPSVGGNSNKVKCSFSAGRIDLVQIINDSARATEFYDSKTYPSVTNTARDMPGELSGKKELGA